MVSRSDARGFLPLKPVMAGRVTKPVTVIGLAILPHQRGITLKIKHGRALARSLAVLLTAGLSVFMGVSSAGAWNVTESLASVSAVHLNGQDVSDISVAPGSTINIKLKYAVALNTGCPGCDEEVQLGFANQNPDQCIGTDGFIGQGNQAYAGKWKFKETAPTAPGSYFLAFAFDEDFGCNQSGPGWASGTPNPQTQYFAHITVT